MPQLPSTLARYCTQDELGRQALNAHSVPPCSGGHGTVCT